MKPGLELPDDFVWPEYNGRSVANIPATIAALLQVPFQGLPPLQDGLVVPLAGNVKRVVLIILDAMGLNLWQKVEDELRPMLGETAVFGQLTSIFPSTTVAALSSLWTGTAPAQHGLLGLCLFFPHFNTSGQMLRFSPTFASFPDALIKAGLEPENFLRAPGFAQQLAAAGIPTYAFKGRDIVESALSKMHNRGVARDYGISSFTESLVQMGQVLEAKPNEPMYLCAYWPIIDTLSHIYGWNHAVITAELRAIFSQLQLAFLHTLSLAARRDTVLCIVADHGQTVSPVEKHIYVEDHPDLQRLLFMKPTGEPRTPYLYARQGQQENVLAYLDSFFHHAMVAYPAETALMAELFGPPPHALETAERVGDVVVVMRDGYLLLTAKDKEKAQKMYGRHGGMTQAEMLVPWLGVRLG